MININPDMEIARDLAYLAKFKEEIKRINNPEPDYRAMCEEMFIFVDIIAENQYFNEYFKNLSRSAKEVRVKYNNIKGED